MLQMNNLDHHKRQQTFDSTQRDQHVELDALALLWDQELQSDVLGSLMATCNTFMDWSEVPCVPGQALQEHRLRPVRTLLLQASTSIASTLKAAALH